MLNDNAFFQEINQFLFPFSRNQLRVVNFEMDRKKIPWSRSQDLLFGFAKTFIFITFNFTRGQEKKGPAPPEQNAHMSNLKKKEALHHIYY